MDFCTDIIKKGIEKELGHSDFKINTSKCNDAVIYVLDCSSRTEIQYYLMLTTTKRIKKNSLRIDRY